ncbi:MAG: serine hydrolase [Verrucomicrobiales bacterium]|nr:serine hydrolase [Verrucomicrobiales bacterium]
MIRILFALLVLSSFSMAADTKYPVDIAPILEPVLKKSKLPSLAGAVWLGDEIRGLGASGVRQMGDPTPVTKDDKYHIGSCTKMMTATLAAILIEDGLLSWETTIGEVLDREVRNIHPDFLDVSIEQLLAHVGGFPKNPPRKTWAAAWENQGRMKPEKQRMIFVTDMLQARPAYKPGAKTVYSNQGYAVAGVMLETLAKKPWEELLRTRIFEPLKMSSAGFRAPGSEAKIDQPRGHNGKKPVVPEPDKADNPDAIGPAGTVHLSMQDWAKYAGFLLKRNPGMILKNPESFDKLNSTLPNSGRHGVGGCLVQDIPAMGGHCLQMAGSNTMWYSLLWIIPDYDMAIVVATNSAPASAFGTCDKAVVALIQEFK